MARMKHVRRIILHHSGDDRGCVESFRRTHIFKNNWKDIGYHWVIGNGNGMENGKIEPGRPTEKRGAHTAWNNSDSIGICLVGDFTNNFPSAEQYDALIRLLAVECVKYDLNPMGRYKDTERFVISGHKDWRATLCPGKLQSLMEQIRTDTKSRISRTALLKG